MPIDTNQRYSRHMLLPEIGEQGQELISKGSVLVVGSGALGTVIAETLVRAGVGFVRIVDRDVIESSNLHRQFLFDEEDASLRLPKAEVAVKKLGKINSGVKLQGEVADVTPHNVEKLITDIDVVVDGTDNVETRYVVNDACIKHNKPWVYGGAVGTAGMTMSIVPQVGPCLRCLFDEPPQPGVLPTCDTVGVFSAAPVVVGALQSTQTIKLLIGDTSGAGQLLQGDVWRGKFTQVEIPRQENCVACGQKQFEFLKREGVAWVTSLCGRNTVQITPPQKAAVDFETLQDKLGRVGEVNYNGITLTCKIAEYELILFPDGRTMIKGTNDETTAKGLYSKYVGS
ncbi:MAG: thiazole biosynthesis adenylyltransferase ThiF [Proteobacteria bacterium]|nr:thiazole biosynthesis adenylyltransferase ThiF [Pseudomonadota bacterium]